MTRDVQAPSGGEQRIGALTPGPRGADFDSARMYVRTDEEALELQRILRVARELRPMLRERQQETEDNGRYAPDIHERFWQEGFYRVLQPRSLGGLELGVAAFFRMVSEVARGCPSTAWCLCLGAGHALQIASYFGERAQREIFGARGQVVAASSGGGQGIELIREERGYRISGTWRYCSGSPYSTHFLPLAPNPNGGAALWLVLDRSQYEVLGDWGDVIGMRGSGSNSIRVEGTFVPDHLVIEQGFNLFHSGDTPGSALHGNPEYGGVFRGFAEGEIACIAVGLAYAAVDELVEHVSTKKQRGTSTPKAELPDFQRVTGLAFATADSAAALSTSGGLLYRDNARRSVSGEDPFTTDKALRIASIYFTAERLVWETVDQVMRATGTSEMMRGRRMERYARDAVTIRSRTDQLDFDATTVGAAYLLAG